MSASTYPVHVNASLDPGLSRWQWLVKWVLVIPHYLVLAFLWVAFLVLSVVAFFAILATGRYPRGIFDFNVGVLRWSWRVAYYAYGALGTDRYPPFTLDERPDYPAHLEIDYPEHLSRGLVLVKWWLLAIPHYIVVGLFLGGSGYAVARTDTVGDEPWVWSAGLIGLLVLVAAVVLLFTGRYPKPVFDFVLGMNRWVLRVAAYAGLMTDQYPPFRLDQGGDDPGVATFASSSPAPPAPPASSAGSVRGSASRTTIDPPPMGNGTSSNARGWTTGRIVGAVLASVLGMASLGVTGAGVALLIADQTARDDAGFVMSPDQRLETDTYAVTSANLEVHANGPADLLPETLFGDAKVTVDSDARVFVGIAPTEDVDRYLTDVAHETVRDLTIVPQYRLTEGGAPATAPAGHDFWAASASGTGSQALTFELQDGDWTVVLMNVDGSAGIDADVAAGAEVPALEWLVPLLLSVGGTGLVLSALALTLVIRGASRR